MRNKSIATEIFFSSVGASFSKRASSALRICRSTSIDTQIPPALASGSMRDAMPEVHQAAAGFVETLRPQDKALVIDFDDRVFLIQDLTSDHPLLKEAVSSTEALGSTALYDALHAAFRKLRGIEGRKAIVLLSDGDDTSSQLAYDRILEEAKAQGVLLYGIGLGDVRKSVLKELSDVTGGRAFFVPKASGLADVYRKIAD
jgi:Ca-activated chloride channel family protein